MWGQWAGTFIVIACYHKHFKLLIASNHELCFTLTGQHAGVHRSMLLDDLLKNKGYRLEQCHKLLKEQSKKVPIIPLLPSYTSHIPFLSTAARTEDWNRDGYFGLWKLEHSETLLLACHWHVENCELYDYNDTSHLAVSTTWPTLIV